MQKYSNAPSFEYLQNENSKTWLIQLRTAVAPALDKNILPHFTDHSISHSDKLTETAAILISPLQKTSERLTDMELQILYAACYLHDIGMQYENAGNTSTINQLNLAIPWEQQSIPAQRDLLRDHHHKLSAEMVHMSVNASHPIIGIQLNLDHEPSKIAALCESHNLWLEEGAQKARYERLTEEGPGIRMPLLAALLRISDILEESRRRAKRNQADLLMLDIYSQMHWWRHYYTKDITFKESERKITIWFEFPSGKSESYSKFVPSLQKPNIQVEFDKHSAVLNKYSINWTIESKIVVEEYSTTEKMPDTVVTAMLGELRKRDLLQEQRQRRLVYSTFKESRPEIQQRIEDLNAKKDSLPPEEYIRQLGDLSEALWQIGSQRSAIMALVFEYGKNYAALDLDSHVTLGTRLMRWCVEEGIPELLRSTGMQVYEAVLKLPLENKSRGVFLFSVIDWLLALLSINEAQIAIEEAKKTISDPELLLMIEVKETETKLLQSNLREVAIIPAEAQKDA